MPETTRNRIHQAGHNVNAAMKDGSGGKVHLDWMYGKKRWTADRDRERAEHHRKEAERKKEEAKKSKK